MSIRLQYAYLHGQVWIYRRNYPAEVRLVLGVQALKQSLKTSDPKVAKPRIQDLNKLYDEQVSRVRAGLPTLAPQGGSEATRLASDWGATTRATVAHLRAALEQEGGLAFDRPSAKPRALVMDLAQTYLRRRSNELRPGGFKSVRYSVGLFASKFGPRTIASLTRDDGRQFLNLTTDLSPLIGKSPKTTNLSLDRAVDVSRGIGTRITASTQKRIWSQVNHFIDWAVYEGEIKANPFRTVRFEGKAKAASYAVLTDEEVVRILTDREKAIHYVLAFCLLTGMRAGEAAGLLREDLVLKGNLGWFILVRPNRVRNLKTESSEREVPMHPVLEGLLPRLPSEGRLFPGLSVNTITKRFTALLERSGLRRPRLVFHSTRKWFITQCERTGVPEHFTASLVGHKSARSENQLTYSIYSAGIGDDQKRAIVDQLRLPPGVVP